MLPKLITHNAYFVVGSSANEESSRDGETAEGAKSSGMFTYVLVSIVSNNSEIFLLMLIQYLIHYISHLSILLYYISRCITRIFSLPEGYKGKYDPYFPPSGNHSDQSESLFYFIPAITPPCLVPLCVLQYYY